MRAVVTRVKSASVTVDGQVIGKIGQGFLILLGVGPEDNEEKCRYLRAVLADKDNGLVKIMLSYTIYKYDALLQKDNTNLPFVLDEIKELWGNMLFQDSKTFWESYGGADDFEDGGSLCHGWTCLPIYIYYRYVLGITPEFMRGETEEVNCSDYFPKLYGEVETLKGKKIVRSGR